MDWQSAVLAIGSAAAGGFLGVRLSVTRLETQMSTVMEEIRSLRASRHEHANMIQDHEARLITLERELWRENDS